ncbi:cytochrome P450 [Aspergillus floccosus]
MINSEPQFGCTILLVVTTLFIILKLPQKSQFPLINGRRFFEFGDSRARERYANDASNLFMAGLDKASIFRIVSQNGPRIVLAPRYVNDIRKDPALNAPKYISHELNAHVPGLEVFAQVAKNPILDETIRTKLTPNLEWHNVGLASSLLSMVARISQRAFLGDELGGNAEWQRITLNYTIDGLRASEQVDRWPRPLRSIVGYFLPSCRRLRGHISQARSIITPVYNRRYSNEHEERQQNHDAMEWFEETARSRPYDPVLMQLALAAVSMHSTADFITQLMFDLCAMENWESFAEELRREIVQVIQQEGWTKTGLSRLELMDSAMKESQRLKPTSIAGIGRYAEKDIELSDRSLIPKGTYLVLANTRMWDSEIYQNPEQFDPYRFLRLRQARGSEAYLISPSAEHTGFGIGKHACPGRFFAAREMKIILCHVLMKYDLALVGDTKPPVVKVGPQLAANPTGLIAFRRREEEVAF